MGKRAQAAGRPLLLLAALGTQLILGLLQQLLGLGGCLASYLPGLLLSGADCLFPAVHRVRGNAACLIFRYIAGGGFLSGRAGARWCTHGFGHARALLASRSATWR